MITSSELARCRAELDDDEAFIQRCLDGTYRGTVLDTAYDVIARDHSGVPDEPTAADIAAAIIAEFDESEPDGPPTGPSTSSAPSAMDNRCTTSPPPHVSTRHSPISTRPSTSPTRCV